MLPVMHLVFSPKIGGAGLFGSGEMPNRLAFVVDLDAGSPTATRRAPRYTGKTRCVVSGHGPVVIVDDAANALAKVGNGVVERASVNMVNIPCWPLPVPDQPRESVRFEVALANTDVPVATSLEVPSDRAGFNVGSWRLDAPRNKAGLWVVGQQFADLLRSQTTRMISSFQSHLLAVVSQKSRRVASTLAASLF